MLNHYPLWKYIILIVALTIGIIYALPNLYGEDPAIQIIDTHDTITNEKVLVKISGDLQKNKILTKSIGLKNGAILARFENTDIQLRAHDILRNALGDRYIIALNLKPATPKWLEKFGAEPMRLGLDLRGGIHFLIQVDMDTYLSQLREQIMDVLSSDLNQQNINNFSIQKIDSAPSCLLIIFLEDSARHRASKYLSSSHHDLIFQNIRNNCLKITITQDRLKAEHEYAVQQNICILRNRVNQLGVAEPLVHRYGAYSIVVELPGTQDTAHAKEILGATATLEFRLVNLNTNINNTKDNYLPRDSEIKYTRDGRPILLYKPVILTGAHITDSTASKDEFNRPQVNIILNSSGGNIMSKFTKYNIGKYMATLFVEYKESAKRDAVGKSILTKTEEVINIASIQSQLGNRFRITGLDNNYEARQLSMLLRAGALVAPIKIVEERIIGPTLGTENIIQGIKSCTWGLIASVIFMISWYRKFGLIAITGLLLNLVLMVGMMSLLPGATLTMPGIAGIVLTLSIAVDANVLINERIKEEIKNRHSIQQAIYKGYRGAFQSIIDSNCTTLITAVILYVVGTNSIKGFAITTAIGIITSMFTSIFGTRAIVNLLYGGKKIKKLSI
ncbi:protein translocase subunit SecD [Candidatus Profftia tarda]|uniref:Protein translocase subunit SecD n=1 Tax=Candidatus Profftia tarda TaxID=1177216 RepID=A0A8E4GID1_9ENTR|nr:protein translocase subunit SecD [Candidatus Profftia tarda]CAD6513022.1 Protein translocase subunit SecD [Candidatus Profftia tarda]